MMNTLSRVLCVLIFIVFICVVAGCAANTYVSGEPEFNADVVVPAWAPPYDNVNFIRYYYLPDIEVYYDVWSQDFVYLDDGTWMFSPSLPPMYAGFDLYNCFVVFLGSRVYEPWMHYHFYVSHYPRYYYRSVYNVADTRDIRGFNENRKREIRVTPEQRTKIAEASRNRPERERVQAPTQEQKKPEFTRQPQQMKYYGRDIGKPVTVQKQMMKPRGETQKRK